MGKHIINNNKTINKLKVLCELFEILLMILVDSLFFKGCLADQPNINLYGLKNT